MISKETEQKAEILKLVGFGFLAPFGRICIEPAVVFQEFEPIGFIVYLIFTLIIGILGVNCIGRSFEILEEKRIK